MQFTIEKNVPLTPTPTRTKYPFSEMEVGDSFHISTKRQFYAAVASSANYAKSHSWCKFASRREGDGGRIWRVK